MKRPAWRRKKFALTCVAFACGTGMAIANHSSLHDYAMFVLAILGTFGAADVADKHLNPDQQ